MYWMLVILPLLYLLALGWGGVLILKRNKRIKQKYMEEYHQKGLDAFVSFSDISGWKLALFGLLYGGLNLCMMKLIGAQTPISSGSTVTNTELNLGIFIGIIAAIATWRRRSNYGKDSGSHPLVILLYVGLFNFIAFPIYMATVHRFHYRRDHNWFARRT